MVLTLPGARVAESATKSPGTAGTARRTRTATRVTTSRLRSAWSRPAW